MLFIDTSFIIDVHKKGNQSDFFFSARQLFDPVFLRRANITSIDMYRGLNLITIPHFMTLIMIHMINELMISKNMTLRSHEVLLITIIPSAIQT